MPAGQIRDKQMGRVLKSELSNLLKRGSMFVRDIVQQLVDNPEDEFQRPRVHSITQGLAELHNGNWIDLFPAHDKRTGKLEQMAKLR